MCVVVIIGCIFYFQYHYSMFLILLNKRCFSCSNDKQRLSSTLMYRKALFSCGARRSDTCNRVLEAGGWLGEGIFSCCIRQVRLYTTLLRKIIVKLYFYLCRTWVPFTLHTCAFRPAENRVFSSMLEFKCVRLLQSNPANLSSPSSSLSLLDIRLLTGRKHQIRAQLSHLGHPIVGDPVYGYVYHPSHPEAAARFVSEQFVLYVLYVERKICTLLVLPLNNVYLCIIRSRINTTVCVEYWDLCLLRNFMYLCS
jgi:hypothetical protein